MSKIASTLELKQTGLTKYLKTLINLDIVEREIPITEDNLEESKRGLYKLKDNFIIFWFRFIFPNMAYIESGHHELVIKKIRDNLAVSHIAYVYEDICIEKMWQLNTDNTWDFSFDKIGRWWNNSAEIDIVALSSMSNDIIFGECKYSNSKVGLNILADLEAKAKQVDWNKDNRNAHFVLFSNKGFTDGLIEAAKTRNDLLLIS
jgi:AAA+ ATPase superfamily predicted ATPase